MPTMSSGRFEYVTFQKCVFFLRYQYTILSVHMIFKCLGVMQLHDFNKITLNTKTRSIEIRKFIKTCFNNSYVTRNKNLW